MYKDGVFCEFFQTLQTISQLPCDYRLVTSQVGMYIQMYDY